MKQYNNTDWKNHFHFNRLINHIFDYQAAYQLTSEEKEIIASSMQQFQLGESSEGNHLLTSAKKFADKVEQPQFHQAICEFIKEENSHSNMLGEIMKRNEIPFLGKHWLDSIFRVLRKQAGLEVSLVVLVTAEIIAVPYYRALRDATSCKLLKDVCEQILKDEDIHLIYQAYNLNLIRLEKSESLCKLLLKLHRLFLQLSCLVVWKEHHKVFKAANMSFKDFVAISLQEFDQFAINTMQSESLEIDTLEALS